MEWVDLGGDPSGSAGFIRIHLTKDTCNPYSVNHDEHAGEQQSQDEDRDGREVGGPSVYDSGAGGEAAADFDKDGERVDGERSDRGSEVGGREECPCKIS